MKPVHLNVFTKLGIGSNGSIQSEWQQEVFQILKSEEETS